MLSPKRILKAFQYTRQGIKSAWQTEAAFKDDLILVIVAQAICCWLHPKLELWLIFLIANVLLLVAELLNTGLEYLADHISTEQHDLLGRAKDVGSAAVFMILVLNIIILACLFWQKYAVLFA